MIHTGTTSWGITMPWIKGEAMSTFHMIVGSLVVVLFIVDLVMYILNFVKGKAVAYHKMVSMAASAFLLLQIVLGFSLLGSDHKITWIHPVVALLALGSVGAEHMTTANETSMRKRGFLGMFCAGVTVVLVLAAYAIGEAN